MEEARKSLELQKVANFGDFRYLNPLKHQSLYLQPVERSEGENESKPNISFTAKYR